MTRRMTTEDVRRTDGTKWRKGHPPSEIGRKGATPGSWHILALRNSQAISGQLRGARKQAPEIKDAASIKSGVEVAKLSGTRMTQFENVAGARSVES